MNITDMELTFYLREDTQVNKVKYTGCERVISAMEENKSEDCSRGCWGLGDFVISIASDLKEVMKQVMWI